MKQEFEKLAAAGKIDPRHIQPLTLLTESGCCFHRSWGFGKIKAVDTVFARFSIDFPGKPGHTMDLAFAAENLKPIPKNHILARKVTDLDGHKGLYSTSYYSRDEFWGLYNGTAYAELKDRYDAEGRLADLYDKRVRGT